MKTTERNMNEYYKNLPYGIRTNGIQWLQKQVAKKAALLPFDFSTKEEWESFKSMMRKKIPSVCGLPVFPALRDSFIRGRSRVDENVIVERVDIYVDEDYAIPVFIFYCENSGRMPALLWNPGWPQDKWDPAYERFAIRMAKKGIMTLIIDHIPFGETASLDMDTLKRTTLAMSLCSLTGISQFMLRVAECMRAGEYLRSRSDVVAGKVAIAGLCQGGMDTWFTAALDDSFCCAAPFCSASTYAIHMTERASYKISGDSSPFPHGILNVCDVEHLHAAIAPRPLLVRSNLPDNWWPVSGFDSIETLCRKIYAFYNAEDKMDFKYEVNEHNLTNQFADALDQFLMDNLFS